MREGEKTKLSAADYNHSAAAAHCDTQHGSDEFLQQRPEDTQFQLISSLTFLPPGLQAAYVLGYHSLIFSYSYPVFYL